MRKYKKQELCNCIKTLVEAHQKLDNVGAEVRNVLLPQCQEMAIQIGTEIENIEGAHTTAVSHLEQYCEEVYLLSMTQSKSEWEQHQKNIQMLLKQTEQSISNDIADSPAEIVFLPYKASMWDALDSVYRAAAQEQNCNVTVIPIPYYNINSEGEVLAVEYEGALFPKDIPITDFRDYDLAKMHPDVIFIHNPYDEYNRVTQVPQEYFSSTLVNYTEHLVYIPYFVARGTEVKEDYCVMPAVRNAWRTFVQSESIREDYVEAGNEAKRIVALGSPKFDMVVRMQENPPAIPEEWKSALEGRKIFLLNTHLNPIINEAEKAIDKLQQIFALFAEREDVGLLWRPHPLSIQTAKSMNPRILDDYMKLIEEFKKIPNGVYDDSADVHRAIAISDAYIGNRSSLVTLYGLTGKPMYIISTHTDANVREEKKENEKFPLSFSCAAELDGYLWAPADDCNGLFKIDIKTGESQFVTGFREESYYAKLLYRRVVAFERKLFFVPYHAKHIAVYCVDTNEMTYYETGMQPKYDKYFAECAVRNHNLYMFPAEFQDIVCLNMRTGEIQKYQWNKGQIPEIISKNELPMFAQMSINEDIVYFPCLRTNAVVKLDLNSFHSETMEISKVTEGFSDVAYENGNLYLLALSGDVYVYNIDAQETKLFWENKQKRQDKKVPYYKIFIFDGYLWLVPGFADCIVRICITTNDCQTMEQYPYGFSLDETVGAPTYKWLHGEVKAEKLILYPRLANMMLCWEKSSDIPQGQRVTYSHNKAWKQNDIYCKKGGCFYRESIESVAYYLDVVVHDEDGCEELRKNYFQNLQCGTDGKCGTDIWKYIKKEL